MEHEPVVLDANLNFSALDDLPHSLRRAPLRAAAANALKARRQKSDCAEEQRRFGHSAADQSAEGEDCDKEQE